MKIDETYDPVEVEGRWYDFWENNGFFKADETSDKPPFTIVIPPPNVTGSLHMGHAMFVTLQDILIRWKRMEGYEAFWLPGTDHAGIATQVMVEREIAKEGLTRHDLGREEFVKRVWQWKEEKGGTIIGQMKRLGASCDWDRERFTMDDGLSKAVREAFVTLYEDGLIYRAERMCDWDPGTQTVLSDLEVEREEEDGKFWNLSYPLADGSGHIVVGTTRPETMLGDTAIAVHPSDERYTDLVGKMVKLPLVGREIPIIADDVLPDPEKGTGAVKVTPAHDPNDFACGERHDLERILVIGLDAKMTENCPDGFVGLDRYAARKKVIAEFDALGLLGEIEKIRYTPGRSSRSGEVVEPLPMLQWFVNAEPMAKLAIEAVESGATRIVPPVWKKTYDHFMYNIRPWCVSRQLWWGHQIPAWYCEDCGHITVSREDATECGECESKNLRQEEDVLDTWFSSGLWPFSTMGWPDSTEMLDKFYPTQVMETGFDILFFWVARMLMMGTYFMKQTPFSDVYLHAMVRDANGKKMSKTKGNVIDPLHMIYGAKPEDLDPEMHKELLKQYPEGVASQGADALRFTLGIFAAQGRDVKLDVSRMEGYRAFLNKMWNASKFVLMNCEDWSGEVPESMDGYKTSVVDRWILHRLDELNSDIQLALEEYRFNDYADALYHFVWHEFCDWYIEFTKPALYDETEEGRATREGTQATLLFTLDRLLRLMHPLCPFITEDIWKSLPGDRDGNTSIMVSAWPEATGFRDDDSKAAVALVSAIIAELRTIRGETNIKPSVHIPELMLVATEAEQQQISAGFLYMERMARVDAVKFISQEEADALEMTATSVAAGVGIRIPLKGLIDVAEEAARVNKELARVQKDMEHVNRKLTNEKFLAKAPDEIVAKEKAKLSGFEAELQALQKSLEELMQLQ